MAAALVSCGVVVTAVFTMADTVAREALGRQLNLYLDLHLARSVYHLMTGTFGLGTTVVLAVGGLLTAAATTWLLAWLLSRRAAALRWNSLARATAIVVVVLSVAALVGDAPPSLEQRTAMPAATFIGSQARHFARMLAEQKTFTAEVSAAPVS